ncbi:MAG TPA: DUF1015 domain-containing protein [Terriglobia bacterium]
MAEILPFKALHYDQQRVGGLGKVVTQPYDKISPEMQARYYEASPFNLARIIRRRADAAEQDPYAAAGREFRGWIERGILTRDTAVALYPYDQEYAVPGQIHVRKRRRGFIGLCRLEEYSAGVVYRHEETLSGPKADRMALLRATRAHFGQIFLLYSDPEGIVEREFDAGTSQGAPSWEDAKDEYATRHEVWRLGSPEAVGRIQEVMRSKKLVIADGHHRYETALAYRNSLRAEGPANPAADYVMATFVRMEAEGLLILPTHRVVRGLLDFSWTRFLAEASVYFDVQELAGESSHDLARWREELSRLGRGAPTFLAYAGPGRAALLVLHENTEEMELAGTPPGLARLDVFLLHRLVLEQVLNIDREAVREEKNLRYEREAEVATRAVDAGTAQVCFVVNATPIEAVRDNAFVGHVMPQKSTDFYPKLLSGLTIYDLE